MRIPIIPANEERIAVALAAVNGKALKHIATVADVFRIASRVEGQLEADKLPRSRRGGTVADWCGGGASAKAYRYAMTRTRLTIQRGRLNARWYLIGITRVKVYARQAEKLEICIGPDEADWIARRALRAYSVRRRVSSKG